MRILPFLILALALGSAFPRPARAEPLELPLLKPEVEISSELVTLGDLFDNAGILAEKAVFRAPDIGTWGNVSAGEVARAARLAGLEQFDLAGLTEVRVVRASRRVTSDDIRDFLLKTIAETLGIDDRKRLSVTLDLPPAPFYADPAAADPMVIVGLNLSRVNGRFEARLRASRPDNPPPFTVTGTAIEKKAVAVLTRSLARGEIVRAEDVAMKYIPVNQAPRNQALGPADVIGRATRRSLPGGTPIRAGDFQDPYLVERGQAVVIVYRTGGLTLTARGRALENGTADAMIDVRNEQSRKTLQAVVTARGTVTVIDRGSRLADRGRGRWQ